MLCLGVRQKPTDSKTKRHTAPRSAYRLSAALLSPRNLGDYDEITWYWPRGPPFLSFSALPPRKKGNKVNKEYYVTINGERIPVSEEVYRAYRQPAWREHKSRKVRLEMERSLEISMDNGFDLVDDSQLVEELVADKLLLEGLSGALDALTDDERVLIQALYFRGLSERDAAELYSLSHQAVNKRKRRILDKLRELLDSQK